MDKYKFIYLTKNKINVKMSVRRSDLPEIISRVEARQTMIRPDSPPVVVGSGLQYSDQGVDIQTDL